MGTLQVEWRGEFGSDEVNELHAEAFGTRLFHASEWDWAALCERHSLGWVTGRVDGVLVGFANVAWDGFAHAWLQDVMTRAAEQRQGVGVAVVQAARDAVQAAGCEHLHVDFDDQHAAFYIDACGFTRTAAGLISFD